MLYPTHGMLCSPYVRVYQDYEAQCNWNIELYFNEGIYTNHNGA